MSAKIYVRTAIKKATNPINALNYLSQKTRFGLGNFLVDDWGQYGSEIPTAEMRIVNPVSSKV